jgi:hypothetical protein
VAKSEIDLGLPFIVPDLVYKFADWEFLVTEWKPNAARTDVVKFNPLILRITPSKKKREENSLINILISIS